jgi:hypothetical protein
MGGYCTAMDEVVGQPPTRHDMRDVAGIIEPKMGVVSLSKPEPTLQSLNIVAVYRSEDDARNAVLALESIEDDDGAVGLTVLGNEPIPSSRDDAEIRGLDPEGVMADIGPRTLKGAAIGAVVGAVLIGGVAALLAGGTAALAGALGGLLLGSAIGAVWGAFLRMGGSDAYRQTFVEPAATELMLVSLHTADTVAAERGRELMAANADRPPYIVRCDSDGIRLI